MLNRDGSNFTAKLGLTKLIAIFVMAIMVSVSFSVSAHAETRSLKLYYIHTKERANIVYKKNGRYVSSGLKKINRFLRDWRRNEPTKMDPKLLDLVWEAYRKSGSRNYIHVVSAYRSPATNKMLRKTRGGQAKKSQHTLGKAMDFYIPGVPVKKLREIGFKLGGGGVGYYPRSGVPFVHLDTGNVRAWPRMSRRELTRLFPRGDTLHIPPDGKRMPGYKVALARYKSGQRGGSSVIDDSKPKRKGLIAALFGGKDEEEDNAEALSAAPRPKASPRAVPTPAKPVSTPGTLLASLPASALPRPSIAPRARAAGQSVPVAITPAAIPVPAPVQAGDVVAPQGAPVEPAVQVAAEPEIPSYQIPIPTQRPAVLIARAQAPDTRLTAEQIEQTLALANAAEQTVQTNAPIENGSAAIAAATDTNIAEQTTELAYALPVPTPAPARPQAAAQSAELPAPVLNENEPAPQKIEVAYAPPQRGLDIALPLPGPAPRETPEGKSGRVVQDQTQTAALFTDSGIATTPKNARPTASDRLPLAPSLRSTIVTADQIDPSRFGSWAIKPTSVADAGRAEARPNFIQNATRAAPTVVYTAGFSKTPPPKADGFSGNAVTFLAVAKFDNATGNGGASAGEPLQVSVPN